MTEFMTEQEGQECWELDLSLAPPRWKNDSTIPRLFQKVLEAAEVSEVPDVGTVDGNRFVGRLEQWVSEVDKDFPCREVC